MNYLFTTGSLHVLESLSFTDTLYAFDFDGTLAPIIKDHDKVQMSTETESLLGELSEYAPIAIISGRSLADLKSRVPQSVKYLVGNHGLEGSEFAESFSSQKQQCLIWKQILNEGLSPYFEKLGISIEDKEYSLSIHYRKSTKRRIARLKIQENLKLFDPTARIILGKLIFDITHNNGPNKGNALLRLKDISKVKFAFFIGDDDTDEDVFLLNSPRIFGVRIGNRRTSSAKYYLKKQSEVNLLLKKILKFHKRQRG